MSKCSAGDAREAIQRETATANRAVVDGFCCWIPDFRLNNRGGVGSIKLPAG